MKAHFLMKRVATVNQKEIFFESEEKFIEFYRVLHGLFLNGDKSL